MSRQANDAAAEPTIAAPPERFNFAQHLLQCNAARAEKLAFLDDTHRLSYGELEQRVRRLASGLRALGIRREERVLLLMQDCTDWPVSFLGAIYAGLVPVAVNTLLTADDYAYMLENSRRPGGARFRLAAAGADGCADALGSRGRQGHRVASRRAAAPGRGGTGAVPAAAPASAQARRHAGR